MKKRKAYKIKTNEERNYEKEIKTKKYYKKQHKLYWRDRN